MKIFLLLTGAVLEMAQVAIPSATLPDDFEVVMSPFFFETEVRDLEPVWQEELQAQDPDVIVVRHHHRTGVLRVPREFRSRVVVVFIEGELRLEDIRYYEQIGVHRAVPLRALPALLRATPPHPEVVLSALVA